MELQLLTRRFWDKDEGGRMKDEKKGKESENVHNDILELYGVTVAHPGVLGKDEG